jgi:molybdate transport system ATP-binding protein
MVGPQPAPLVGTLMLQVDIKLRRGDFALDTQFTAPTPGVTALFGRSGCGKTTLVNLLAGLITDGDGRLAIDDEVWFDSARGICMPAQRRRIGYVFQDARLFPHYTVRGNLLYGAPPNRSAGSTAFDEVVGLLGLEALLLRRPGALSGGERQRVALGRALLAQPRLLLLDEPLASLDASRRGEVLPYLARLRDHFAIPMVFVSHQFDEVLRLATHLVVMDQGRIVAAGDVGALSLGAALHDVIGIEAAGSVLDGEVVAVDTQNELATVNLGSAALRVAASGLQSGQRVRLRLLAREVILATTEPRGLSVRNQLQGRVATISDANDGGVLIAVDIGGATVLARITHAATRELQLAPGVPVWVLVKAVSVSRHTRGQ